MRRGESLLKSRNPAAAAIVLENAAKQEPERTSIREMLGRALYNSGHYGRAADQFRFVIDRYPTNGYAHYCLGRCGEKLGDESLSLRHFRLAKAFGYDPE